ncbi:AraC family transcriptional regulator [Fulvivirgaceae bacterium BMA10]|uniref:AraC family transcriptional regulator n=1 Tax=Splendidivirga corallicola TaxID=3051826 RepID=A0ABT8KKT8_9BACT|nr:AraC family transcriptional regulator [Fulvivirgaceae bacterium BMA10]
MDLYHRIVKAKLFIDDNCCNTVNLDHLSQEACLSKFHFLRLFKRTYNKTPHQYLTERRIEKAKTKLSDTDLKVQEICMDVGFESVTSFTLKFRSVTGQTPMDYRKKRLKIKQIQNEQPDSMVPGCFATKYVD